jgi:hypothetical protein
MSFKKNARVHYTTPRGGQQGYGKITEITETSRGLWYSVTDSKTGAVIKLRAANIVPAN